jgi:DNA-binding NarL/FixJ family response regulator
LSTFQQKPVAANDYHLSDRELGVLQLLVKGYTYKAIAAELFITMDTVRKHVTHIYEKLHVSCGNEAVALAIRQRII